MKRLTVRQYASALHTALTGAKVKNINKIAEKFLQRLRRDHALRLIPRILSQLKIIEARSRGRLLVDLEAPTMRIAAAVREKIKKAEVNIIINPELRRGVALTVDDQRIDATLAGRLAQLKNSLVTKA